MNPLISCVVPTYNSERYLKEALESIFAQTYRPFEIIIADDGSTDNTESLAISYGDQIRFVKQKTSGPAATRNLGLNVARGEFVAFLDADDLWHPEKLFRQMSFFRKLPEPDLCLTHAQLFWTHTLREEKIQYRDHPRSQPIPGYSTTTLLVRRNIFDRIGLFNTQYWFGDATDWLSRAIEQELIIEVLPDVLTYHRMHESNLTRRRSESSRGEFLNIVKASLDRRRKQSIFVPAKNFLTHVTHRSPFLSDALSVILPTPDQTLLLCACLWTGEAGREAWTKWQSGESDHKQAFRTDALYIELLPLLHHALEKNKADVNETLLSYLKISYFHEELRSKTYLQIFKEAVSILTACGVPFLVLDGIVLAKRFYGDYVLRHCHKLNFLVKKEDMLKAANTLLAEGNFKACSKNLSPETNDFGHVSGLPVRLQSFLFQPPHDNPSISEVWRHAEEITVAGIRVSTLCIVDHLLEVLGCASSSGSCDSLRWVCDAWYLLDRNRQWDWNFLFHRAAESHLVLPFFVMFRYLAEELQVQIPTVFLDRLAAVKTTKEDHKAALSGAYNGGRGFKNLFKHSKSFREWIFLSRMLIQKKIELKNSNI